MIATRRCWVARYWVAWQMRSTWVGQQVKLFCDSGLVGPTCWVLLCLDTSLFECWLMAKPRFWVARDWVAWQTRSTWVGHQVKQCHDSGLLGPTCWVVFCLDASLFEGWKLLRNRMTICELRIVNSVVLLIVTMDVWNILELLICDICRWLWIC